MQQRGRGLPRFAHDPDRFGVEGILAPGRSFPAGHLIVRIQVRHALPEARLSKTAEHPDHAPDLACGHIEPFSADEGMRAGQPQHHVVRFHEILGNAFAEDADALAAVRHAVADACAEIGPVEQLRHVLAELSHREHQVDSDGSRPGTEAQDALPELSAAGKLHETVRFVDKADQAGQGLQGSALSGAPALRIQDGLACL